MKSRWFIGAGVVVALVVLTLVWWQRGQGAKADQFTPEQVANDIASGKTITLGDGVKVLAQSPANGYFALPDGPQRVAYLDKMIDDQEAMRKKIANGDFKLPENVMTAPAKASNGEVDEKLATSVKQETSADGKEQKVTIRMNADDLSPALRAQMQEFHAALRNRRKERGLDPDAPMMFMRTETRTMP